MMHQLPGSAKKETRQGDPKNKCQIPLCLTRSNQKITKYASVASYNYNLGAKIHRDRIVIFALEFMMYFRPFWSFFGPGLGLFRTYLDRVWTWFGLGLDLNRPIFDPFLVLLSLFLAFS